LDRGFTCHYVTVSVTEQKAYTWNGEANRLLSKLDNISALNHSSIDISSDNCKLRLAIKMVEEKILPDTAFSQLASLLYSHEFDVLIHQLPQHVSASAERSSRGCTQEKRINEIVGSATL